MSYHVDPEGVATFQQEVENAKAYEQWQDYAQYQATQSAQHVCPNCGYCPCCGRRNLTVDPYVPYYPPYTPI